MGAVKATSQRLLRSDDTMSTKPQNDISHGAEPQGDPWAAFGYLVAGVAFYGGIGIALSVWLDASYLVPIGILVGAAFGIYMVFARYRYRGDPTPAGPTTASPATARSTPIDHDPPAVRGTESQTPPPDRDDRGDSS